MIESNLPAEPPVTSDRATFDDRIEQLWFALQALPPQVVTTGISILAQHASALSDAPQSTAAARMAMTAAETAVARGDPEEWQDAPASYSFPDTVIASNGITYRCLGQDVVGVDPAQSTSYDWRALDPDAAIAAALLYGQSLMPGWAVIAQGASLAVPSALVWSRGTKRYRANLDWVTTGAGDQAVAGAGLEYSGNSGAAYVPIPGSAELLCSYDASGALIGITWVIEPAPVVVLGGDSFSVLAAGGGYEIFNVST
jgi:hypothetical protein